MQWIVIFQTHAINVLASISVIAKRHGLSQHVKMNLKQLEIFVTVAEQGSFSRAAEVLGTVQPALSRQVRALELDLREHLFQRNGRGVELTEAGQRLLIHSRNILQLVQEAHADFGEERQEPKGHIVVGMPPSMARKLTVPLISHFKIQLPKARLEIVEGFSSHMVEWLISGRVDLCLLYNPDSHLSLEITPLMQDRLCLVGRKGTLPNRQTVSFSELPDYPLIIAQRGQIFRSLMEAQATLTGVKLDVAWEVSSVPVILDLLKSGHGYAVLAESALTSHQADSQVELEARRINQPKINCTLCLAQRGHFRETLLVSRTKQALQQVMCDTAMLTSPVAPRQINQTRRH